MKKLFTIFYTAIMFSCTNNTAEKKDVPIRLVTLDPGHFHAALVQKTMYAGVDSVVHVYAPASPDLQQHLSRIAGYNDRAESPTSWKESIYTGNDFFEKMIAGKKGDVVVLSGNNKKKTDYILQALENGFHVFADKPMAIDAKGFEQLKTAFDISKKNNLLLYDIMTERYEITTILQRELSMMPELFGELEKGTPDYPAIRQESVHHFFKNVSGSILTRPAWFFDVTQQGEGIVDVMTHLVDLVQWECFPEQAIDYPKDIQVNSAKRWPTLVTIPQFKAITKLDSIPPSLSRYLNGDTLNIYANGEINYTIKGVHAKTTVIWNYSAPNVAGDSHFSIMRGTKALLTIKQGVNENYQPTLYISPGRAGDESFEATLTTTFQKLEKKYPGISLKNGPDGSWQVMIPDRYKESHEAHFGRVTEKFLGYLKNKNMPAWEVPNMLAKYYTTTTALQLAQKQQP